MKKWFLFTTFILLIYTDSLAASPSADSYIKQSRELAAQQHYEEALTLLDKAQKDYPDNVEIKITIARILSWQGNYEAAEKKIEQLGTKADNNADVMLLEASLAYYQQDYDTAILLYQNILATYPDYEDARKGLERIKRVQQLEAESSGYKWQMDIGYEHSNFARRNQPAWDQEFLQLTRFINNRKTAIHGMVIRYDQFRNVDTEFAAGINHSFTNYLNGYISGAVTPVADFRPKRRIAGGGAARIIHASDISIPVWITLDTRYDMYEESNVLNVNPGIRVEPFAGWAVASRMITVDQDGARITYGRDYRLDGTVTDKLRFYVGYADAPETVAAITVKTKTYFGGIILDIRPDTTLRLGYAHDDRENSYIRQVANASISYRF